MRVFAIHSLITLIVAASQVATAEDTVRIEPREKWSAVFGESDVSFAFDVVSDKPIAGRLTWLFSANQRTISRGESPVAADPDKPASVTVPLRIPPVKEGVVFEARLSVALHVDDMNEAVASFDKPIWIYSHNPFVDRTEWLKQLQITLYDPEGQTAAVFDRAEIPYHETRNSAALAELKEGLLVIGERVSLETHRGVPEALAKVAARGVPVLCLAPADGSFALPGSQDGGRPAPKSVTFQRSDAITQLDKRLDAVAWPPDGKMLTSGLLLKGERDRVMATVTDSPNAWPWLEVRYPKPGATLLICGFGIIERWDAGPTPRFLLARLFDYLTEKPNETSIPQNPKE
jgi:hypothetical protein